MPKFLTVFWQWYERNYALNISVAAGLFALQLLHLLWLLVDVIWFKLFGHSLIDIRGIPEYVIVLIDYTEIPAIIATSIVYINELRKRINWKSFAMLFFINSQWLHLFWITDEFVVEAFAGDVVLLPVWLAWVAILIDYLELPVIYDTIRKAVRALREEGIKASLEELRED